MDINQFEERRAAIARNLRDRTLGAEDAATLPDSYHRLAAYAAFHILFLEVELQRAKECQEDPRHG